jgi:hypothetical protein
MKVDDAKRLGELRRGRLGLSQRRTRAVVGQHHSTQRRTAAKPDPDRELRALGNARRIELRVAGAAPRRRRSPFVFGPARRHWSCG